MQVTFVVVFITLPIVWCNKDLFSIQTSQCEAQLSSSRSEVCLNIGGGHDSIGKYLGDHNLVTYFENGGKPKVHITHQNIDNTNDGFAYSKQMGHYRELGFKIFVKKGFKYDLTFGFACISNCIEEKTETTIFVQNEKKYKLNVYSLKKERNAITVSIVGIKPIVEGAWGKLDVRIANPKTAMLATLCIKRKIGTLPPCSQNRCHNFQGKFSVAHLYSSGFVRQGTTCRFESSSTDVLQLGASAKILRAFISWSAVGTPAKSTTSILLNKQLVTGSWTAERIGYLAHVDVTSVVAKFGNGGYLVEGIENNGNTVCIDGYSAWSMTVLYEQGGLPLSNINICAIGFSFEFSINCVRPELAKKTSLLMAVTETDILVGDDLYINGNKAVTDVFDMRHGQAFDVVKMDISKFVSAKDSKITLRHTHYSENVVYMMVVISEIL